MLDVCLLGTGGMMPLPNRYLTSLLMRYNGNSILIDCGEGTQVAIRKKGWSMNPIAVICITHFHGDHISGLPGLLLSMGNAERTEPVTIVGPRGLERVAQALRVIAPELPFPIEYIELDENFHTLELYGYTIEAFRVQHNVVCYGYNIKIHRAGRFLPELAAKNQVPQKCWSRLQKGETFEYEGRVYSPDMVLGPPRKGIKLTYCTDSRPVSRIAEYASDADLFICEGMYGGHENDAKAKAKKHMTFLEAAGLARDANVHELWLTHYSPSMIRPEEYLEETSSVFSPLWVGRDGKTMTLTFEPDDAKE